MLANLDDILTGFFFNTYHLVPWNCLEAERAHQEPNSTKLRFLSGGYDPEAPQQAVISYAMDSMCLAFIPCVTLTGLEVGDLRGKKIEAYLESEPEKKVDSIHYVAFIAHYFPFFFLSGFLRISSEGCEVFRRVPSR